MKKDQAFWLAVLATFVVLVAADIFIHRILLSNLYQELAHFWRPADEMKANAWVSFLADFSLAFLLTLIYPKGYEKRSPLEEGFRFGILMGLLLHLPSTLIHYYVYPYPVSLLGVWFVGGVAEVTLAGVVIALCYKKTKWV